MQSTQECKDIAIFLHNHISTNFKVYVRILYRLTSVGFRQLS